MNSILVILKEWYDARYGILLACVGLSSLAFFVMFMENKQYADTRKKQRKWLESYVFAPAYFEAVQKRYPEVSMEEVAQAYEELRAYFLLCWNRSPQALAMPATLVDSCWQQMIINTRSYHKFCQCAFGCYLHHEPDGLVPDSFTSLNDQAVRERPPESM
jgi:hypothetical protein